MSTRLFKLLKSRMNMKKKTLIAILFFASFSIADDLTLNNINQECDKLAPHGLQTTTCLFGGGGIMLLGLSILAYSIDPDDSSLFLVSLGSAIVGTTFTGLSIGFQVGSCKNWKEYKKCINTDKNNKTINLSLNVLF